MSVPDPWNVDLYERQHAFVWEYGAGLVDLLAPRPGERILDLGCGTGQLTAQLAASGASVIGLDQSPTMIAHARSHHSQLRFEIGDARDFTFGEPFDAVFSNAALHWVREPELAIACIARALRPGGRFVAELGGRGNVRRLRAALDDALRGLDVALPASPWYFPGVSEYTSLLEQAGLEVTLAALFERPTPLEGATGLRDWIAMFAPAWLAPLSPAAQESCVTAVETALRPTQLHAGKWHADYRRLRVVAWRRGDEKSA